MKRFPINDEEERDAISSILATAEDNEYDKSREYPEEDAGEHKYAAASALIERWIADRREVLVLEDAEEFELWRDYLESYCENGSDWIPAEVLKRLAETTL